MARTVLRDLPEVITMNDLTAIVGGEAITYSWKKKSKFIGIGWSKKKESMTYYTCPPPPPPPP